MSGVNINVNPFSVLDKAFGFSEKKQQKREDAVARRNYNWAKEFAQNSMQWKADDLRKAGINPVYAMGAGGYSAPVSSTSPVDLAPSGSVGVETQVDRDVKKATANKINAEANKLNAEAKGTQTVSQAISKASQSTPDYTYMQGLDGTNRVFMSQNATEALENDMISRMGWHGRHLTPLHGTQLEEFRNNLWNTLLNDGKVNPFTQDILVSSDRSYKVVPRGSAAAKMDFWEKVQKPNRMKDVVRDAIFGKPKRDVRYPFSR